MEKLKTPERDLSNISIESERLTLKPTSLEHSEEVFREFNDNVTKFLTRGPNESLETTQDFIKMSTEEARRGEKIQLTVTDKNGDFLGLTSIERTNTKTPEFGLWLKETAQGKGFGPELIFSLYDWAAQNLDVDHFIYRADRENIGSWKIAEKLLAKYGGEYVGEELTAIRGQERPVKTYHFPPKTIS